MLAAKPENIDAYIASFPKEIGEKLESVRSAVHQAGKGLEEVIKYGMPTFMNNGNLVFFAAFKNHIGFYGIPKGNKTIDAALRKYRQGRGSVQFPFDQPIPLQLITKIVQVRIRENAGKIKTTKTK